MGEMVQLYNAPLRELARMIHQYCGINYMENLSVLESKISRRLSEMQMSCWEYAEFVKKSSHEREKLIELITINETYFFREEGQLNELQKIICTYKDSPSLKIWSAACSTGEEPYSIAMTIADSGIAPQQSVKIIASDINKRVLETAKNGWYHQKSLCFRRTNSEQLARYFEHKGEGYEVRSDFKAMVDFRNINLLDAEQVEGIGEVDIIFCRNVLIYFDHETISKLLAQFYKLLKPGGLLFLGHAETIREMNSGFETIHAQSTFYYRKGGN